MPATGTNVDRIEVDRLKNSTLPLRTCASRSVSEPSWLAGNSLMSSLPPVASRMRASASWARVLTGCCGSCPVANLYSNSAAEAGRFKMPTSGTAMPAARTDRRVMPRGRLFAVVIASSMCRSRDRIFEFLGAASRSADLIERFVGTDDLAVVGLSVALSRHGQKHLVRHRRQRQGRPDVPAGFQHDAKVLHENVDGARDRRLILHHPRTAILQHPARGG